MLSYFAAWILKARHTVFKEAVQPPDPPGKAGRGGSRQLRGRGVELARELQLVQENAKTFIIRDRRASMRVSRVHAGRDGPHGRRK
jgi:hypothetical protein